MKDDLFPDFPKDPPSDLGKHDMPSAAIAALQGHLLEDFNQLLVISDPQAKNGQISTIAQKRYDMTLISWIVHVLPGCLLLMVFRAMSPIFLLEPSLNLLQGLAKELMKWIQVEAQRATEDHWILAAIPTGDPYPTTLRRLTV